MSLLPAPPPGSASFPRRSSHLGMGGPACPPTPPSPSPCSCNPSPRRSAGTSRRSARGRGTRRRPRTILFSLRHLDRVAFHEDRNLASPHPGQFEPDDQLQAFSLTSAGGRKPGPRTDRGTSPSPSSRRTIPPGPPGPVSVFCSSFPLLGEKGAKSRPQLRVLQRECDIGLRNPACSRIVPDPLELVPENPFPGNSARIASVSWISPPHPGGLPPARGRRRETECTAR